MSNKLWYCENKLLPLRPQFGEAKSLETN
jgi:hypothetical protein